MRFWIMARGDLLEEALTRSVIGAFYEVYNHLGFGFLEHLYVTALERELLAREHDVTRELCVRVMYKGQELGAQRLDMIVDDKLVVETKSSSELHKSATRQLYNYLHATNLEVGLLLHFGPRPSFHRVICRHTKCNPEHPSKSGASV
ncbi:MAG: GxxExxY protein [Gemmatimonadota bacterium]|nr:GxxExxY protein [Gemmatimonadota bacterium]